MPNKSNAKIIVIVYINIICKYNICITFGAFHSYYKTALTYRMNETM